jgi:hypothetical protein
VSLKAFWRERRSNTKPKRRKSHRALNLITAEGNELDRIGRTLLCTRSLESSQRGYRLLLIERAVIAAKQRYVSYGLDNDPVLEHAARLLCVNVSGLDKDVVDRGNALITMMEVARDEYVQAHRLCNGIYKNGDCQCKR